MDLWLRFTQRLLGWGDERLGLKKGKARVRLAVHAGDSAGQAGPLANACFMSGRAKGHRNAWIVELSGRQVCWFIHCNFATVHLLQEEEESFFLSRLGHPFDSLHSASLSPRSSATHDRHASGMSARNHHTANQDV